MEAIFWAGFVTGSLICLVVLTISFALAYQKVKRKKKLEIETLIEQHRKDWEALHYKLNHTGKIPNAATIVGLLRLISLAISRCINVLKQLLELKDWNTRLVISELQMIIENELAFLHTKLGEFLELQRQHLREYHDKIKQE